MKSDGQPCILDFGVARVTEMDPELSPQQTSAGQLIGTLPYMSPEQVSGNDLDVDTRSDVYSLGVIAYELLTGKLPYDAGDAEHLKAARTILETEPARLFSSGREFRGDLNTIVLKSLEKGPERRYQSANELANDIQRYLNGQPIEAMAVGPVGRFWKWCHRNTEVAGLLSLLAIAIVLGFVATTMQTRNALKAKGRAEDSAQSTERVLDLLVSSFRSPDTTIDGPNVKMVDVLNKIASDLEEDLTEDPLVKARLLHAIGESMQGLRTYDQGVRVHKAALAI